MPGRSDSVIMPFSIAGVVGKAAEIAEHARIGLRAAEAEAGGDGERHLIAAVRKQRRARPAAPLQHGDGAAVLRDAVGLRRIDLDDVVAGAEAAEAHEVLDVLRRIQVFAGRQRRPIDAGEFGEQREVERVARLLEPAQLEGRERFGVAQRLRALELAIGVDRKLAARRHDLEHRLQPPQVLVERQAADLHLHHACSRRRDAAASRPAGP